MIYRLRQIDLTAAGREIVRTKELDQDRLAIGRAAENDIHLPDLAIEKTHVQVTALPGGKLKIESVGGLGFTLDGRTETVATIDPREGAELALGSYRLEFIGEDDGSIAVTIRRVEGEEGRRNDALSGFSLASTLPSKRVVAWSALIAILLAFLAIPIFSHAERTPAKSDFDQPGAVMMDASWSPGALSSAHHGLEDNCEACHVQAFVAVRDNACLSCHEDIGDHAQQSRMSVAHGKLAWGDALQQDVARLFNKPGPGACTDCHTEHEGAGRMEPTRQEFCADCHGSLDKTLSDTTLGDASDFGIKHPQFKALVSTVAGQPKPQRISLDDKPHEANGLRFPHKMHLDPKGGVARMASRLGASKGYGASLECSDCHHPTADGVRFLPVNMETDCEACHSLVYDKVGSTFRTLRHGDIDQMQADLVASDRSAHQPVATGRKRPGPFAEGGIYHGNFGQVRQSRGPVAMAMSTQGVCGECHIPTTAGGRLGVTPVNQPSRYFEHGWFNHDDHKQEKCSSCHAAQTSENASDLLLPDIAQCRTCHLGENSKKAEVPSGCAMCHSYHPREGAPALAGQVAMRKDE